MKSSLARSKTYIMDSRRIATIFVPLLQCQGTCRAAVWICLGVGFALGGCNLSHFQRKPDNPPVVNNVSEDALRIYLDTMTGLTNSDPARQADIFYEVESEYTRAPTTASTLRYAVALVTPEHPAANPAEGKKLLENLLATPERMVPAERSLALILMHETAARLKVEAENRRLLATLDDRNRAQANSEKRAQAQIEENARLRRLLNEAQRKLDAIKEIETSISERSPTPLGNRDTPPSETQGSPPGR